MIRGCIFLSAALFLCCNATGADDWQPKRAALMTRWAKDVTPDQPLPEYPRPQMVRTNWQNLNGLWEYAIRPKSEPRPEKFDGKILVPFPVESALSGVMQRVGAANRLWYRRTFEIPEAGAWQGQRVLLHFGAVDWEATVYVNGKESGTHRGGYDPFSFDITEGLAKSGPQEIVVSVWDPTTDGTQPVGKQHNKPEGIWYTPTTGIWQTVWLEPVSRTYVRGLKITPDAERHSVTIALDLVVDIRRKLTVSVTAADRTETTEIQPSDDNRVRTTFRIEVAAAQVRLWSPDDPYLYPLRISLTEERPVRREGLAHDSVASYFAMRDVSVGKDSAGVTRLMLNNKPLFQFGPLDQGFWPDGLYTAPTDEALRYDIEVTKRMGFNMIRKHVKVEPARWYHHCDKLGMLVWQDLPNGDRHVAPGQGEISRTPESRAIYDRELRALIDTHYNSPCIVMWVPFNEGWGQFDTERVTKWVKEYDPSRLVNCASGWNDVPVGDVHDIHVYPGPDSPKPEEHRAAVLGEYGGLGLPLKGHTWQNEKNWGYRSFTSLKDLSDAYFELIDNLHPLIGSPGLSAAVYTQTTDVEIEVNGLLTYNRDVIKIPVEELAAAHARLYGPPPRVETAVHTSEQSAQSWRHTLTMPADDWAAPDFDEARWKESRGGFGEPSTPGSAVRTEWKTPDIWIRRKFDLPSAGVPGLYLRMHHDEDAEVYINGVLATKVTGYTTGYRLYAVSAAARSAVRSSGNVLAIHCRQTGGGQYIDAGLVRVTPAGE